MKFICSNSTLLGTFLLFLLFFISPKTSAATSTSTPNIHDRTAVIEAVEEAFADVPAMVEIARCESKFRQYTDSGNTFYGGYGQNMVGVFQIYEAVHGATATNLGHDLTTLDGNLAYARYLYEMEGLTPWNSSRDCWETALDKPEKETPTLTSEPSRTELEQQIKQLQQIIVLLTTLLELKASLA